MKTRTLKQLLLYNYRYWFGYTIIALFVGYFLFWQLGSIAPGLSQLEMDTAARNLSLHSILKMPTYPVHSLMQWASIKFLGISSFSIKLPSVIISILTAYFIYLLLKRWFGKSTAMLSTTILISADWFLFIGRHGAGMIEFSMWLAVALSCFTKLLERKYRWLLLFAISIVGLVFSPIGIYAAFCLGTILLFTRVFRERMLEAKLLTKITGALILLLSAASVVLISYYNPVFAKTLIGIEQFPGILDFFKNIFYNTASIVAVLPVANPEFSPVRLLFVRFFELTFIIFGILMLYKTRVNRLNFSVIILSLLLVVVSGFMPTQQGGSLLFIPAAIFITAGIRHLMHRWRQTFPSNPYARVVAYIPLGVLFICITLLHYQSYFILWPSQTEVHQAYLRDYSLINKELNTGDQNKSCLVISNNQSLKSLVVASKTKCTPVFEAVPSTNIDRIVVDANSDQAAQFKQADYVVKPLLSETMENNVRWLVAKPNSNQ